MLSGQKYRGEACALCSPCQRPQKLLPVHVVLERLVPIDENYGDLIVVPLQQLRIGIDVHLAPSEVGIALELGKRLLHNVTKMTSLTRIHHNFMHKTIVSGR